LYIFTIVARRRFHKYYFNIISRLVWEINHDDKDFDVINS